MNEKEPGQKTREAFEVCFIGYAKMIMQPGAWDRVSSQQKAAWAQMEASIEAPHLAEIERLKARVAELEEALATNEIERQAQIGERKRAEARVRAWEAATDEQKPRVVKARLDERDAIVGKLGEAIELAGEMMPYVDEYFKKKWGFWDAFGALSTYHASLTQELPPDLPLRTLDAARIPGLNRDEHLDRPKPERDHVHEVGSCSFCDRALRQGATPCLTWQGPEFGGRCRACGGSKEEHEGRS